MISLDLFTHSPSDKNLRYVPLQHRHCCYGWSFTCPFMDQSENFSEVYHQELNFWNTRNILKLRTVYCLSKWLHQSSLISTPLAELEFSCRHTHPTQDRRTSALLRSLFKDVGNIVHCLLSVANYHRVYLHCKTHSLTSWGYLTKTTYKDLAPGLTFPEQVPSGGVTGHLSQPDASKPEGPFPFQSPRLVGQGFALPTSHLNFSCPTLCPPCSCLCC